MQFVEAASAGELGNAGRIACTGRSLASCRHGSVLPEPAAVETVPHPTAASAAQSWNPFPVTASRTASPREADLYGPVKVLLEDQGYVVKGEIVGCDVVAVRGDEPPVVVELKRTFGLALVLQGIDRLALTDAVYLAVGTRPRRLAAVRRLCRRLGLGLIVVARSRADVLLDPLPYQPRKSRVRVGRLLDEHRRRVGDPTGGGSVRRPIMTAYRQEALRCAGRLEARPAAIREVRASGDVPHAARILRTNVYGWFERVERGVYTLSPRGRRALAEDRARSG